ncbi:MAG: DUF3035 domain-containing protein [Alphaproteobacteria bacterium]|jgi:hypothetical protein|nr:DUF3035 domain-containing protein [Alphaproteobacteria bacterium]
MKNTQTLKSTIASFLLLSPLLLSGCDSFRNTFGLDHYSPDEMSTATPSPGLIIPPGFNERPLLPPPTPGAPNPHVIPESVKAQQTVLGDKTIATSTAPSTSKGEKEIIEKASENQNVTPNIRSLVDEESQTDSTVSGKVIAKIKSWNKEITQNMSLSKSAPEGTTTEKKPLETKTTKNETGSESS